MSSMYTATESDSASGYTREGVGVRLGHGIELSVVNTEAVTSIFFPNHNYRARPGARRRLNDLSILHVPKLSSHLQTHSEWHPAGSTLVRFGIAGVDREFDKVSLSSLLIF